MKKLSLLGVDDVPYDIQIASTGKLIISSIPLISDKAAREEIKEDYKISKIHLLELPGEIKVDPVLALGLFSSFIRKSKVYCSNFNSSKEIYIPEKPVSLNTLIEQYSDFVSYRDSLEVSTIEELFVELEESNSTLASCAISLLKEAKRLLKLVLQIEMLYFFTLEAYKQGYTRSSPFLIKSARIFFTLMYKKEEKKHPQSFKLKNSIEELKLSINLEDPNYEDLVVLKSCDIANRLHKSIILSKDRTLSATECLLGEMDKQYLFQKAPLQEFNERDHHTYKCFRSYRDEIMKGIDNF